MTSFDLSNPNPKPGDSLRDLAANLLTTRFGRVIVEHRVDGKKVDIFFIDNNRFGKPLRYYVEAKDYNKPLGRSDVVSIWSDYSGILRRNEPSYLLVITKNGLTPDAQAYISEMPSLLHQTIWELENETLGLQEYVRNLSDFFSRDGLSNYYIDARGREATYTKDTENRIDGSSDINLVTFFDEWIGNPESQPIAVLGGYGTGKTSLGYRIASKQAENSLRNPLARIPIFVRLGSFSRYASLDGILVSTFSAESHLSNFSFSFFKKMNEAGRLLIILDGFDEMKHAMSWSDFRAQVKDLNQLVVVNSKVILLGRPNAFMSFDEHILVLRGKKRFGKQYRRLPDWPEFREFDVQPFTDVERKAFIENYLRDRCASLFESKSEFDTWVSSRATEVNRIADSQPEIFSKPVHAKILSELARVPDVDLSIFIENVTQWDLYKEFFNALLERKIEKDARKPYNEMQRLNFLRRLAFWLWTEKDANTWFSIDDIPTPIFSLDIESEHDIDVVKREFLTGAFLEKKSGEICYFVHRSFSEFLVADFMLSNIPTESQHSLYSIAFDDGVGAFMEQSDIRTNVTDWLQSLFRAKGFITLRYLSFIINNSKKELLENYLNANTIFKQFITQIFEEKTLKAGHRINSSLIALMKDKSEILFFQALSLYCSFSENIQITKNLEPHFLIVAAAILDRVFKDASQDVTSTRWKVPESSMSAVQLAGDVMPGIYEERDGRIIPFLTKRLAQNSENFFRKSTIEIRATTSRGLLSADREIVFKLKDISAKMSPSNARKLERFTESSTKFQEIFAEGLRRR